MTTQDTPIEPQKNLNEKQQKRLILLIALVLFSLLLIITSLTYTYFTWKITQRQQNQLQQQSEQIQQRYHFEETMNYTLQEMTLKTNQLENSTQQALKQKNKSEPWLLLQARYYLELAAINAYWNDNHQITAALLQQADHSLSEVHLPQTFSIRQKIAEEIALNAQIQNLDIAGLLSQLDAEQRLLTQLPFKKPSVSVSKTTPLPTPRPKNWHDVWQASLQQLQKLVVIRHDEESIYQFFTPEYQALLSENIRLNLQMAQWAVLHRNTKVYQLALQQAIDNIQRGFDTQSSNTEARLKQLQALKDISLEQPKQEFHAGLDMLNDLIVTQTQPRS